MKRLLAIVLVVGIVTISGCSMLGGPPSAEWLDGTSVNESVLLENHFDATNESVVRLDHRNGESSTVYYFGPNESFERSDDGGTWSRDHVVVTNDTLGSEQYSVTSDDQSYGPEGTGGFALGVRVGFADFEFDETIERDGQTLQKYELTEQKSGLGSGHYITGTLVADERGRIHSLQGMVGDNESAAVQYEYDFDWAVKSVPQPSWVETVPLGDATLVNDNRTFKLQHTGGRAIPSGTTLSFWDGSESTDISIEQPLTPGDSMYVAVRENGTVVTDTSPFQSDEYVLLAGKSQPPQVTGTITFEDGMTVSVRYGLR